MQSTTPAALSLIAAALLATPALGQGALNETGALECIMDDGEAIAFERDVEAGTCRFGTQSGELRDGMCRISDPLRRVSLDEASGALVFEDTESDEVRRGVCGPG